MEKQILSSFQRLPVLKSSFAGLDTITKKDLEFGFEDYLGGMYFLILSLLLCCCNKQVFIIIFRSFRKGRYSKGCAPIDGSQTQAVKTHRN